MYISDSNSTPSAEPAVGRGYLTVRVTTARGAIPLEGAQVTIRSYPPDGTPNRGDVLFSLTTDSDGRTERIGLPAPSRTQSMQPGMQKPFATYTVDVYMEGYTAQSYIGVPIFDGISAVQPAVLIPLPENGRTDSRTPDDKRFFESNTPDL